MAGDLLGLVHTALNLAITAVAVFIQKIFISVVFGRRLPVLAGADFLRQNEASDPWGGPFGPMNRPAEFHLRFLSVLLR